MSRCNKEFREVPFFVKLHKELNNPTNMHNFGSVDRIMLGLCSDTTARRDEYITDELTNHLFQVVLLLLSLSLFRVKSCRATLESDFFSPNRTPA